jgi:hypothetical protein
MKGQPLYLYIFLNDACDLFGWHNEKFILLWGNTTCGDISVDWRPCA